MVTWRTTHEVAVDVSASVVKTRSLDWFVSSWQSLAARPTVAIKCTMSKLKAKVTATQNACMMLVQN